MLRDPEHEALFFFIEKVLHAKNREALEGGGFELHNS